MRIALKIAVLCLLAGVIACQQASAPKQTSVGSPYELLVVAPSAVGDTLRSLLRQPVEYLDTHEPQFDCYVVAEEAFGDYLSKHRNIVRVKLGSQFDSVAMAAVRDVYAVPQVFVSLTAPDAAALAQWIRTNGDRLTTFLENAERERFIARARKFGSTEVEKLIEEKFGLRMAIPKEYRVRSQRDDFMWLSAEHRLSSQGIIIYSHPVGLPDARRKFFAFVPGPSEGSNMDVYDGFVPVADSVTIGGRRWIRERGFWEVKGDFMGGPFVSVSTNEALPGRTVVVDCYVYSPEEPKRNYLRQLEALQFAVRPF